MTLQLGIGFSGEQVCGTCTNLITERHRGVLTPLLMHRCALMPAWQYHVKPDITCRFEPSKWTAKAAELIA